MRGIAQDIMHPPVITVTDTMALREAAKMLVEERISGAPVVDDLGNFLEYELATERALTEETPFDRRPYDDVIHPGRGFQIEELSADTVKDVMTPY